MVSRLINMEFENLSEGLNLKREGNKLFLEIELDDPGHLAKSGKSLVVFTTSGFVRLPGPENLKLSMNIIKPITKSKTTNQPEPGLPPF
jgi:hypothetical protein